MFNNICNIINQIKTKYPDIKIILCEITPRKDNRDEEVIKCNRMFNTYASSQQGIYLAHHSNLRDETYSLFRDNKHIKGYKIVKFAANIKRALRVARVPRIHLRKGNFYPLNTDSRHLQVT